MVSSGSFRKQSQPEQIDETLEAVTEFLALFRLELAHQGFLELGPVIGQAIANAPTAFGERNARGQLGADGLADDQLSIGEAVDPGGDRVPGEAQFVSQIGLGGAGAAEHEQHGIVAWFQTPLGQWQQQGAMRQLPGLDEPVKR